MERKGGEGGRGERFNGAALAVAIRNSGDTCVDLAHRVQMLKQDFARADWARRAVSNGKSGVEQPPDERRLVADLVDRIEARSQEVAPPLRGT